MKPPKNFSSWMGFEPENTPLGISPFEIQNIQAALNRGSFVRMPSNGSVPTSTKKFGWGGVLSAGLGMVGNIVSTAMTNRANREMQREANEQNERLWREQMEYNSPVNQMARFKQAELNPNLAYGDNGNAGAPPEYVSSKNQAPQFDPMAISNALLLQKQIDLADAERANIEADTRQKTATAVGQENENSIFDLRIDEVLQKLNIGTETINEIKSRIDLNSKEGQHKYQLALKTEIERKFDEASFSKRLYLLEQQGLLTAEQVKVAKEQQKQIRATVSQIYANIELMKSQKELVDQQRLTEIAETALRQNGLHLQKSQIDLNRAMQFMYGALQGKYNSETALNNLKGKLVQVETREKTAQTLVYEAEHGVNGVTNSYYASAPILSVIYTLIDMIPG